MQLRDWQAEAYETYATLTQNGRRSMLCEAVPGAGKTTFGQVVAMDQLRNGRRRIGVVTPTAHLKKQWAQSGTKFNIQMDYRYDGRLSPGFHGVAVTYAQLANDPQAFAQLLDGGVLIADEVHHAGTDDEGNTWGRALTHVAERVSFSLALSGTPFRSDDAMIPFLRYENGISKPDYIYGYGRAIAEQVVRPCTFVYYGGEVAWRNVDGTENVARLEDHEFSDISPRLRAALDADNKWITKMLKDANDMLTGLRIEQPNAGALATCMNQEHARQVGEILKEITGETAVVVVSDNPKASDEIDRFKRGRYRWLVACNMVSEGVDVPRLRLGAYVTAVTTRMFFRQFIGRFTRRTPAPGGKQMAYCYLPVDPRLYHLAREIEEAARHHIPEVKSEPWVKQTTSSKKEEEGEPTTLVHDASMPHKTHNTGVEALIHGGQQLRLFDGFSGNGRALEVTPLDIRTLVEESIAEPEDGTEPRTLREQRAELGREIRRLVTIYHNRSGRPFNSIYNELNQWQRVQSQAKCNVAQLNDRLTWLESRLR